MIRMCKVFYTLTALYHGMTGETVTISKREFERLKKFEKVDQELLQDIARGIKDISEGKVKEV